MRKNKGIQARDLITMGVLNAVFMAILIVTGIMMGSLPVVCLFMPAAAAIPLGPVFLLMLLRVGKPGSFLIICGIQAVIMIFIHAYWPLGTALLIAGVLGESLLYGGYRDMRRIAVSYLLLMSAYFLGSFLPFLYLATAYQDLLDKGYNEEYINSLFGILSGPVMLGVWAVTLICAWLGYLLGKRFLRKHFARAGMV